MKGFLSSLSPRKLLHALTPRNLWHHKWRTLLAIIVIGILVAIFFPKKPPIVKTVVVKPDSITEAITASGTIESETSVNLNFLAGGRLVYLGAQKGEPITKGQTVATIDQRTLKKNLEQVMRDANKQRNDFDDLQEDNQNRKPYQALNDEMRRVLENNQYDLDKAIASIELQQIALEQSYLLSPIDGTLIRADATVPGVNITAATTYTVADTENLLFKIDIDEADIGKISPGMPVNVTIDAYPDNTVPLEITAIDFASHQSDTGGNVYTVEAKLPPNVDQSYRIGMSGDAEVVIAKKNNVLTVPLSSLIDNNHIYVKKKEGTYRRPQDMFEKRTIVTGLQSDLDIEVTRGLKAGEEVVEQPEEVEKMTKN